jgi:uncharacterized protein YndB with AHSA1/START domain
MTSARDTMYMTASFEFAAPPEVVYNTLTDPHRARRWLPPGLQIKGLAHAASATDLRLTWRTISGPEAGGTARVEGTPAGGSVVRVEIDAAEHHVAAVYELIADLMHNLERDVSDNFTAG